MMGDEEDVFADDADIGDNALNADDAAAAADVLNADDDNADDINDLIDNADDDIDNLINDDNAPNIDNDDDFSYYEDDGFIRIEDVLGEGWPEEVGNISLDIICVLGNRMIEIADLLRSGRGAVIELDRGREEPVTLMAEGKVIAEGTVMIEGDQFCVSVDKIVKEHIKEILHQS